MSHRRLTEGCRFALQSLADEPLVNVYNRTVASNLRVIERVYPELIRIVPPPACDHIGARPFFGAMLTERGRNYITPRKARKLAEVHA
jgi:hypothetical protein